MKNFPGNPYGTTHHEVTSDTAAIVDVIALLAFELRTLNLQIAARPVLLEGVSPDMMRKIEEATVGVDADIRCRLALDQ